VERSARTDLATLLTMLSGVAALYFGRAILMPLALAVLATFALTPLVQTLERRRLGRVPAVVAVCLLMGVFATGVVWIAGREAGSLASDIPQYRTILREKIQQLRGPIGSLSGAAAELSRLADAIEPVQRGAQSAQVEVVERSKLLGTLGELLFPLVGPLGTLALVVVLTLFMLLEREELRDRLIWLMTGARDLSLTTRALDDAATRLSRYLAMQSLVCAMHGAAVGIGLWSIGVPGAALWGALSAGMRFVPYFGPWIAAALPILLSFAVFHGWTQPLLTVGLFVALELVTNNVLEPWLYGASVGLSPFGVVSSSVFWAWLWGIPGLLLATPLTVCLVVAGRYVRGLQIFPVLLGDQPALPADARLYQRLVALDLDEAATVLDEAGAAASLEQLSDSVVLPALRRLADDDQRDALTDPETEQVRERLGEILTELVDRAGAAESVAAGVRVLFVPALDENDALAGRWLARVCEAHGAHAVFASPDSLASEVVTRVSADVPDAICISALTPRSAAHARLLCKRLEAGVADCDVLVGLWSAPLHELGAHAAKAGERSVRIATATELITALRSLRVRKGGSVALPRSGS
jgi:predicted PurR-regulated permease PerM